MANRQLLLISSSVVHGGGYLDHAEGEIRDHLRSVSSVLFVPYALKDHEAYCAKVCLRFERMGYRVDSIHRSEDPRETVRNAEAIFIGGGNTFRLLKSLYEKNLLEEIRSRVDQGMLYMGSSAGTNVACPTIRTTNDMPIVEPPSLTALGLVHFQINPHYLDPDPNSKHMGETREERIREYLEENDRPVVGLREGAMIRVQSDEILLKGISGARIFRREKDPVELHPIKSLSPYL
ncbi:dipeptidase PepE [bacterium]|nr:dipeptidase PepE [bacterium]